MGYPSVSHSSGVSHRRFLPHDLSEEDKPRETPDHTAGFVKAYYFVKSRLIKGVSKPLFQQCYVNPKTQQIIKVGEPYFWEASSEPPPEGIVVCKKCGYTVPDSVICAWCAAKLKDVDK